MPESHWQERPRNELIPSPLLVPSEIAVTTSANSRASAIQFDRNQNQLKTTIKDMRFKGRFNHENRWMFLHVIKD